MDGLVESALEEALPGREVEGFATTGPSWNKKNHTVRVEFADADAVYCKVAADGDGSRIARERAAIAFVGENSRVPVPEVVAGDPGAEVPHLVTAPVTGESYLDVWSDAGEDRREELVRAVGRSLAGVHAFEFEAHGHVVGGSSDGLQVETAPWPEVLVDRIERAREIAPAQRFEHHYDRVIAAVEDNRELLEAAPATLVHGDPAKPNCFLAGDRIGFLDWEIAHVGDPVRELRRARRQQIEPALSEAPEGLVAALHEGYREVAGSLPEGFDRRKRVYDAVAFLGTSGFFQKLTEFLDEPAETLAERVQAEMDRRLARI